MTLTYRLATLTVATLGAVALSACGAEEPTSQDFISDDPQAGDSFGDDGGLGTGDGDGDGDNSGGDDGGEGEGEGPNISEADILQLEGNRLYALSPYSGLTVVDMQDPDDLRSLGTWDTDAQPFEMYVENAQAFVMFSDFGFWDYDEDTGEWSYESSSRLVALDASDPANIAVKGEFTLPGRIQDSRRVGDVLYLVTMQDGWCWGCDEQQKTVVTSIDISDQAHPALIDQLAFEAPGSSWDWQRSVESTTERMYVAARSWAWEGLGSSIDVIDISAGDGSLVAGAQVQVTGTVFSRWQMDEHEGVLRVISQLGWTDNPLIETFLIESADSFVPLGSGELTIPEPESLRSARFDGDRAYAITAEQTDPLFTIDLSDPANPQQIGELEIPGWVYHMETRGDRILALGFDPDHPNGSINVSLFDVSDFAAPSLTKRVHFGGSWASFAEDQNRIHKAFTILDDENMLLVPYTGWDFDGEGSEQECSGSYRSGVQIVDWLDDDLTVRGLVPARGRARRAFTYAQRIVTLSDVELATFDYANRDAPQARDSLTLAVNVNNLVRAGDHWVRLSRDWWTSEQRLEIVDGANPGAAEPLGVIDIGELGDCEWTWIDDVFAHGDHVFVVQMAYSQKWDEEYHYTSVTRVIAVDISDPSAPVLDDIFEIPGERSWGVGQLAGVSTGSKWMVQLDDHLVFSIHDPEQGYEQGSAKIHVVDLSDPSKLEVSAILERPAGQTQGQLSVLSDTVVSWHTEPVEGEPGKVRFYFDRLDLSGAQPAWSAKVNVPGIIVAYDDAAGRAFTVDFKLSPAQLEVNECYEHPKFWSYQNGKCTLIERALKRLALNGNQASLVATVDIEGDQGLQQLVASDSRIFAKVGKSSWGYYDDFEGSNTAVEHKLVLVDLTAPITTAHQVDAAIGRWWWISAVDGVRAVVHANYGELGLVDASDAAQAELRTSSLPGWGGCYNPVIDGDTVYCPMGAYGLATVEW